MMRQNQPLSKGNQASLGTEQELGNGMNQVNDATSQLASHSGQGRPTGAVQVPEQPALAATVHLVGELHESGFKEQQWLIQRSGHFLQLSELLYRVAEQVNGERTFEEIAAAVTQTTEWIVSPDHVRHILQTKFIPMGLLVLADGSVAPGSGGRARVPFGFKSIKVLGPGLIDPITGVLRFLYTPFLFVPVLLLLAVAHGWLYLVHGITTPLHDALYAPGQLLLVGGMMVLASLFHEFGHASALRYGGGRVRGMGAGVYLFYPMFYTDVTESYRLGRWARLRTDIGGFYFELLFALGSLALYLVSRQEFLLSIMVLTDLAVLSEVSPLVRFDGYWVLTDLVGIPDLFSQASPFLRSVFSQTGPFWQHVLALPASVASQLPNLKPWVKVVFVCYLLVAIFGLPALVLSLVLYEPHIVATTWGALLWQKSQFLASQSSSDRAGMVLAILQAFLLVLALCGNAYVLYSAGRRASRAVWKWSQQTRKPRLVAATLLAGFIVLVAVLWTPQLLLLAK
jgi:putative peptide zinc metalloprotease protein